MFWIYSNEMSATPTQMLVIRKWRADRHVVCTHQAKCRLQQGSSLKTLFIQFRLEPQAALREGIP
jgi:hypothetical protein